MSLSKTNVEADELTIIATFIGIFLVRNSRSEADAIILGNILSNIGSTMLTQIAQQHVLQTLAGINQLQQPQEIEPIIIKEKI